LVVNAPQFRKLDMNFILSRGNTSADQTPTGQHNFANLASSDDVIRMWQISISF
jgi:hypothetical protein